MKKSGASKSFCLLPVLLLLFAPAAQAQYSIDWFSVDGGGETSTGITFSATGAIGQMDAGRMSGTYFTVNGGFWSIIAVQTSGAPLLSIARQGANARVFWPLPANGFLLDHSATVTGIWSQVSFPYTTNESEISISVSATGNKFYRLRKP